MIYGAEEWLEDESKSIRLGSILGASGDIDINRDIPSVGVHTSERLE